MILLLLAAGRGSRMKEYTSEINKCLLMVNEFPIIYYSLKIAEKLHVSKVVIVVGYQAEKIIKYVNTHAWPFSIEFVCQCEQKGIVHAMYTALPVIQEDILLNLGDEILINSKISSMIKDFYKNKADFMCGVMYKCSVEEIQKAYSITLDIDGKISSVIEKPQHFPNDMCGTGYCIFKFETLQFLHNVPINRTRNQYELCDFINLLIKKNKTGYPYDVGEKLVNINTIHDLNFIKERLEKEND